MKSPMDLVIELTKIMLAEKFDVELEAIEGLVAGMIAANKAMLPSFTVPEDDEGRYWNELGHSAYGWLAGQTAKGLSTASIQMATKGTGVIKELAIANLAVKHTNELFAQVIMGGIGRSMNTSEW